MVVSRSKLRTPIHTGMTSNRKGAAAAAKALFTRRKGSRLSQASVFDDEA